MIQLTSASYDLSIASLEIILLLATAFITGAFVCYLLRLSGLCCCHKKAMTRQPVPNSLLAPTPAINTHGGSYEADIGSLIRSHDSEPTPTDPTPDTSVRRNAPVMNTEPVTPAMSSFEERARASLAGLGDTHRDTANPIDYTLDIPVPDDNHVDDLKKLEGISPAIEKLLNEAGIKSYAKLATMDRDYLKSLLEASDQKLSLHEPKSWPYQAELAAKNNWSRLREYQDFLLADHQ